MKKIIFLFFIVFSFCLWSNFAYAQGVETDCGEGEVNIVDLISGQTSPEDSEVFVCLGDQILTTNSQATAVLNVEDFNNLLINVSRGSSEYYLTQIDFGAPDDILKDEYKGYAEKSILCPIKLTEEEMLGETPGAVTLSGYSFILENILDPGNTGCSGSLVNYLVSNLRAGEEYNQEGEQENIEETETEDVQINDPRIPFSALFSSGFNEQIENATSFVLSSNNEVCSREDYSLDKNSCLQYYHGSEMDKFGNPVKNMYIEVNKENYISGNDIDLVESSLQALEEYDSLVDEFTQSTTKEFNEDENFKLSGYNGFTKFNSSLGTDVFALKDSYVIRFSGSSEVSSEDTIKILNELSKTIDEYVPGETEIETIETDTENNEEELVSDDTQENEEEVVEEEAVVPEKEMYNRLRGKIVLKVEENGEAYYVNPKKETIHFLGYPEDAFRVMREQGVGITTADLNKIQPELEGLSGPDDDGDGLPNLFEDAIKTDRNSRDTDGDGYDDLAELKNGYNPSGAGKLEYSKNFVNPHLGKIFLQVENNGEAWYINPTTKKRHFLGRPTDAYNVMRNIGLGISSGDFEFLENELK